MKECIHHIQYHTNIRIRKYVGTRIASGKGVMTHDDSPTAPVRVLVPGTGTGTD
jgi:hypothetical protein